MNKPTERRSHPRYPASKIKVLIKSLRNDGDWEQGTISTVDFNRFGIGLETDHNFAIGDILSLLISTDDATIAEVNGLVCNRSHTPSGYRFGVRFEHTDCQQELSPDAVVNISEEILMIEREAASITH